MASSVIIVGAGGFGRELLALLHDFLDPTEYEFKGFLDQNRDALSGFSLAEHVIGDPDIYVPTPSDRFVLAIGDMHSRRKTVESLLRRDARFMTVIHPSAIIAPSARIGMGNVIYPFAVISNGAALHDFVHVSLYGSVGHDATVGRYCLLAPYATLNGFAILEDEVYMSTHSTVVPEKRVGKNSTVSANSAVLQDVPPNSFVYGITCKQTRKLRLH